VVEGPRLPHRSQARGGALDGATGGTDDEVPEQLTKAEASEKIDELKS
jgi:hypothetical protein